VTKISQSLSINNISEYILEETFILIKKVRDTSVLHTANKNIESA
jgi:hypothetical protein